MLKGNPRIIATNGEYDVIQRGDKIIRYGLLKKGDPLSSVLKWGDLSTLAKCRISGGYQYVMPPKEYTEE